MVCILAIELEIMSQMGYNLNAISGWKKKRGGGGGGQKIEDEETQQFNFLHQ